MFLCVYISLFPSCLCAASCVIINDDDRRSQEFVGIVLDCQIFPGGCRIEAPVAPMDVGCITGRGVWGGGSAIFPENCLVF